MYVLLIFPRFFHPSETILSTFLIEIPNLLLYCNHQLVETPRCVTYMHFPTMHIAILLLITAVFLFQVCVFVNISPLHSNMAETISTLDFGQNVRQVELGQAHKHITKQI